VQSVRHRRSPRSLLGLTALLTGGCAWNTPQTSVVPHSDFARSILYVYGITTWVSLGISLLVFVVLGVIILRFRDRPGAASPAQTRDAPTGGLAVAVGPDEFVVAGTGLVVVFEADSPGDPLVGILSAQEGKYVNGQWTPGRWLNGDQTHQGRHIRLPSGRFDIQRVKLYRYR